METTFLEKITALESNHPNKVMLLNTRNLDVLFIDDESTEIPVKIKEFEDQKIDVLVLRTQCPKLGFNGVC